MPGRCRAGFGAVTAVALIMSGCGGSGSAGDALSGAPAAPSAGGGIGETLPDVDVTPLVGGEAIQLSDLDGPAVVNLWATWCAPCRAEIPDFEEVHQVRGDEVTFVGINVGEDPTVAAEFIEEVGASYQQFADLDGDVSIELRATSMPVTVVIDGDGFVTTRHLGPLDQDGLNEAIDEALGVSSG